MIKSYCSFVYVKLILLLTTILIVTCCRSSKEVLRNEDFLSDSIKSNDSMLVWSASRKLMVSDFRLPAIDSFKMTIAESSLSLHYSFEVKANQMETLIYSVFNRYKSWTVDEDTIGMLNHEQRHFDLEEIACRMIRKEITINHNPNGGLREQWSYVQIATFYFLDDYLHDEQLLYDRRTNHGTYPDKQKEWDKYIDSLLFVYKDYANPVVLLPIRDTL